MSALLAQLAAAGPALSARVIADMYAADPFWEARFGERGRRHSGEDGDFHVKYLSAALEADDPGVMARYAVWLREVLCSRGMCTRHLAENLERLARAIAEQGWPDGHRTIAVLEAAVEALAYPEGPARQLYACSPSLAAAVAVPGVDTGELIDYLADALAAGDPAAFVAHARWRAGRGEGDVARAIAELEAAIGAHQPALAAATAHPLAAARDGLAIAR